MQSRREYFQQDKKNNYSKAKVSGSLLCTTAVLGAIAIPILPNNALADVVTTIQKGDSLWSIAKKNNTTVEQLKTLNQLDTDKIFTGNKLVVQQVTNETSYVVLSGDSLWSIAKRYESTADEIKTSNQLFSDLIYPGQVLKINIKEDVPVKTEEVSEVDTTDPNFTHIVQQGESLWSIADQYDTTANQLMKLNHLQNHTIYPGQELKINGTITEEPVVTTEVPAQPAEVVYEPVEEPVSTPIDNGTAVTQPQLNPETESNGNETVENQEITPQPETPVITETPEVTDTGQQTEHSGTHTVASGDTLYSIARNAGISVNDLKAWNNLTSDDLTIGQQLSLSGPATGGTTSSEPSNTGNENTSNSTQNTGNNETNPTDNGSYEANNGNSGTNATPVTPTPVAPSSSAASIIATAQQYLGKPYVYGSTDAPNSFDCSSFTQYVYGLNGVSLPRVTTQQEYSGSYVSVSQLQPGDLMFWGARGSTYHVGIYMGNNQYIHASTSGSGVIIGDMTYYQPSFGVRVL